TRFWLSSTTSKCTSDSCRGRVTGWPLAKSIEPAGSEICRSLADDRLVFGSARHSDYFPTPAQRHCQHSESSDDPAMTDVRQLSVVVPAFNEQDNVASLVNEIVAALRGVVGFEIVFVDDGSDDNTLQTLRALK